tara:strand:- start:18 stop:446 length:429 start_codon:yes stop_codon:yes gene_type:complete
VPTFVWLLKILKGSSAMQGRPIVKKEEIAPLESEAGLQGLSFGYRIKEIKSLLLITSQVWTSRINIRSINQDTQIGTSEKTFAQGKNRLFAKREFISRINYVSFVRKRVTQNMKQIGAFPRNNLFDFWTSHHLVFPTRLRWL